jgi:hypothetical protein
MTKPKGTQPELPGMPITRCLMIRRDRALRLLRNITRNYNHTKDDSSLLYIDIDEETFQDICDTFNKK